MDPSVELLYMLGLLLRRFLLDYPGVHIKAEIRLRIQMATGRHQANLVLIAYASSEGSGEPAHPRSLARTSAARSYKQ